MTTKRGQGFASEHRVPPVVPRVETLLNITHSGVGVAQNAAGTSAERLLPKYGMHAFRHAAASLFIADAKQSPKEVQALMGLPRSA
jgi:hypothetical protein